MRNPDTFSGGKAEDKGSDSSIEKASSFQKGGEGRLLLGLLKAEATGRESAVNPAEISGVKEGLIENLKQKEYLIEAKNDRVYLSGLGVMTAKGAKAAKRVFIGKKLIGGRFLRMLLASAQLRQDFLKSSLSIKIYLR